MQRDLAVHLPSFDSHRKEHATTHIKHIARRTLVHQIWAIGNVLKLHQPYSLLPT